MGDAHDRLNEFRRKLNAGEVQGDDLEETYRYLVDAVAPLEASSIAIEADADGFFAHDPGRELRAEQRARTLLRSCVNEEEWEMYRDLGLIRVWGAENLDKELRGVPYAYLVYPHKPIVAYLPQTGRLLNEYCVEFPDETRPYGSTRLPDSDDVLAKWMALTGDERRIISSAIEHHAVLDPLDWLAKEEQAEVELVPVDRDARIDVEAFRAQAEATDAAEQMRRLDGLGIPFDVTPGVPAFARWRSAGTAGSAGLPSARRPSMRSRRRAGSCRSCWRSFSRSC